ncbi:L10-interacting MYB domain-containing protein-like [Cannabis sativa]|uniref:L10-interacting MYB domain-containing protein-like n=1 Tax=Cannabis sativa TaxID=3483 RepID=UPI0029C9B5E5|nr:L10-interacting MYB domain-containing protein-like [Cannabis sativa]
MEKEKNICTKSDVAVPRGKAIWNSESVNFFLEFCIKEVDDGHRPTTYLDKIGYQNLITNMKKATERDYTRAQLKNKWDGLKNEWKLWKQLKGKETGLGWSMQKNTIDATEDWWNSKLQTHPDAAKFRIRGIEPEVEEKLDKIFMNTVATGEHAWTPSSGIIPSESEKPFNDTETLHEQLESSDDDLETPNIDRFSKEKISKRSTEPLEKQNKKVKNEKGKMKKTGPVMIFEQIGRLADAVETRSRNIEIARKENSIAEVMKMLNSLPEIEKGSSLYLFATRLFIMKEKREMFASLEEPELMLTWLKNEYTLEYL